jgi:hypothetical protein
MTWNYGEIHLQWRNDMTKWLITFAFAHKESLRLQKNFDELNELLSSIVLVEMNEF